MYRAANGRQYNYPSGLPISALVKRRHGGMTPACPLYHRKQTLRADRRMSALCQKQTFALIHPWNVMDGPLHSLWVYEVPLTSVQLLVAKGKILANGVIRLSDAPRGNRAPAAAGPTIGPSLFPRRWHRCSHRTARARK